MARSKGLTLAARNVGAQSVRPLLRASFHGRKYMSFCRVKRPTDSEALERTLAQPHTEEHRAVGKHARRSASLKREHRAPKDCPPA